MKNEFEKPVLIILEIESDDIISTSGTRMFAGFGLDPDGTGDASGL